MWFLLRNLFPFIPFCWKESDWKCFSNVYGLNVFFPCRARIFLLLVDCSNLSNPNIEFIMCIRRAKELTTYDYDKFIEVCIHKRNFEELNCLWYKSWLSESFQVMQTKCDKIEVFEILLIRILEQSPVDECNGLRLCVYDKEIAKRDKYQRETLEWIPISKSLLPHSNFAHHRWMSFASFPHAICHESKKLKYL